MPEATQRKTRRLPAFLRVSVGWLSYSIRRALIRALNRKKARQLSLIEKGGFFDAAWYLEQYPDIARRAADPALHYLDFGARELRDPGPDFDTAWYVTSCPQASSSGLNPLVHFMLHGRDLGFSPMRPRGELPWWDGDIGKNMQRISLDAGTIERLKTTERPVVLFPVCRQDIPLDRFLSSLRICAAEAARVLIVFDEGARPFVDELRAETSRLASIEFHGNTYGEGCDAALFLGAELAGSADLLIVDPMAILVSGLLWSLRVAALRSEKTGCAVPLECGEVPEIIATGRAIAQTSSREAPLMTFAMPAALYMRRDCLEDMVSSPARESQDARRVMADLVEQALKSGWQCVVDDGSVVFSDLPADAGPSFFCSTCADPDVAIRVAARVEKALDLALTSPGRIKPRVMFVLSTLQGGTPQTNQDLMLALGDRLECFVLHSNAAKISLSFFDGSTLVELASAELPTPIDAFPHRSTDYDSIVADWMLRYAIDVVHLRHVAWHGLGLIEMSKALGIPTVFSFHDFYAVCPTVKLLDDKDVYCGGVCTQTPGDCTVELWPNENFPPLKHAAVRDWRANMSAVLELCDAFVTTSERAREVLVRSFPFLGGPDFHVISHGRDFERMESLCAPLFPGEPLRLLFLGGISVAKGGRILEELARAAPAEGLEIHILGTVAEGVVLPRHVVRHGPYLREEVVAKVAAIRPHLGAVLSIWPETYCHTLTELWAAGIPVIGFDIGAIGERISKSGAGWLTEMKAAAVLELLRHIRENPDDQAEKIARVVEWQQHTGSVNTCSGMADAYFSLYRKVAPALALPEDSVRR